MASLTAPIVYAIRAEDEELAIARIKAGGDVNFCEECYGYPIIWAVQYGQVSVVKELLKNGADPNATNICDYLKKGATPLYFVTDYSNNSFRGKLKGDDEIRKLLKEAGGICKPRVRTKDVDL